MEERLKPEKLESSELLKIKAIVWLPVMVHAGAENSNTPGLGLVSLIVLRQVD